MSNSVKDCNSISERHILERVEYLKYNKDILKVMVDVESLDYMDWSWDSLNFPYNKTILASIINIDRELEIIISTRGDVKVRNMVTDSYISSDSIPRLVRTGEILDRNIYFIESSNYFSIELYNSIELVDSIPFEEIPQNVDDIIEILLNIYKSNEDFLINSEN